MGVRFDPDFAAHAGILQGTGKGIGRIRKTTNIRITLRFY
jgi:hypothetical protein